MKKTVFLFIVVFFLTSCGSVTQSEFAKSDKMYKNWDHMKFSWFGHNNPTAEDLQKAQEQKWWGIDVPYVPGE